MMRSQLNLPGSRIVGNVRFLLMPSTITDEIINCRQNFERQVFRSHVSANEIAKLKMKQIEALNY